MSDFAAAWLDLREPYDAASAAPRPVAALIAALRTRAPLLVVDLGAGTGALARALAPHLPAPQLWLLIERDPALIDAGMLRLRDRLPPATVRRWQVADLAVGLAALLPTTADLVTASALLDLVSATWLEQLVALLRQRGLAFYSRLSFDGTIRLRPSDPFDATIARHLSDHQRRDKGFGPALGPDAHACLLELLQPAGGRVVEGRSDWQLGPDDREIQRRLLTGWAEAARETAPSDAAEIDDWLRHRLALLEAGRSRLRVGHRDLLWLPPADVP